MSKLSGWGRPILIAASLFLGLTSAHANSIWARRNPRFANFFEDTHARHPGDILTIVVLENTDIEHKDQRDQKKNTQLDAKFNLAGSVAGNSSSHKAAASFDSSTSANKEQDSKSDYTSDHKFVDRMSVVVVDVLPNGNLVIEGYRKRVVSGESRMLMVRGIVWPTHIGPANTIQSQFIANFEVYYLGKGSETSFTSHGWFGKMLNSVWPY